MKDLTLDCNREAWTEWGTLADSGFDLKFSNLGSGGRRFGCINAIAETGLFSRCRFLNAWGVGEVTRGLLANGSGVEQFNVWTSGRANAPRSPVSLDPGEYNDAESQYAWIIQDCEVNGFFGFRTYGQMFQGGQYTCDRDASGNLQYSSSGQWWTGNIQYTAPDKKGFLYRRNFVANCTNGIAFSATDMHRHSYRDNIVLNCSAMFHHDTGFSSESDWTRNVVLDVNRMWASGAYNALAPVDFCRDNTINNNLCRLGGNEYIRLYHTVCGSGSVYTYNSAPPGRTAATFSSFVHFRSGINRHTVANNYITYRPQPGFDIPNPSPTSPTAGFYPVQQAPYSYPWDPCGAWDGTWLADNASFVCAPRNNTLLNNNVSNVSMDFSQLALPPVTMWYSVCWKPTPATPQGQNLVPVGRVQRVHPLYAYTLPAPSAPPTRYLKAVEEVSIYRNAALDSLGVRLMKHQLPEWNMDSQPLSSRVVTVRYKSEDGSTYGPYQMLTDASGMAIFSTTSLSPNHVYNVIATAPWDSGTDSGAIYPPGYNIPAAPFNPDRDTWCEYSLAIGNCVDISYLDKDVIDDRAGSSALISFKRTGNLAQPLRVQFRLGDYLNKAHRIGTYGVDYRVRITNGPAGSLLQSTWVLGAAQSSLNSYSGFAPANANPERMFIYFPSEPDFNV